MIPQVLPTRFLLNPVADRARPYGHRQRSILDAECNAQAFLEISSWGEYHPTPLLQLPGLARKLGIGSLWYKDEGNRLGLGSFKALGGAYGVLHVLKKALPYQGPGPVTSSALLAGRHRETVRKLTVACASLGNHGRSVAWGAAMFGCRCVVLLPGDTEADRISGIQGLGAHILLVDGTYDDAVALAAARGREEGWHVVSDTAYPGYEEIPRAIMQGYTVLAREALEQLPEGSLPTHVFLQAGVGGMAAAVAGYLWEALGPRRPAVTVVEPAEADCLFETALFGRSSPSRGSLETSMSCLACRDPSTLAWPILEQGADAFMTIPDYAAEETVTLLEGGELGDPRIGSQPSGVAGLAGLLAATFEPTLSGPLHLGENSVVMVIGSEGPNPPEEHP